MRSVWLTCSTAAALIAAEIRLRREPCPWSPLAWPYRKAISSKMSSAGAAGVGVGVMPITLPTPPTAIISPTLTAPMPISPTLTAPTPTAVMALGFGYDTAGAAGGDKNSTAAHPGQHARVMKRRKPRQVPGFFSGMNRQRRSLEQLNKLDSQLSAA